MSSTVLGKMMKSCSKALPFNTLLQQKRTAIIVPPKDRPKGLDSIVKLDLFSKEHPERVKQLWKEYHSKQEFFISHELEAPDYIKLRNRSQKSPMFVYPIARGGGYFTMLQQHQNLLTLFTSLEAYKLRPDYAPPHLNLTFYTELLPSKGVVLIRGEVDTKTITRREAQWLLEQSIRFYIDDELYRVVETFNQRPREFNFDLLCRQMGVNTKKDE